MSPLPTSILPLKTDLHSALTVKKKKIQEPKAFPPFTWPLSGSWSHCGPPSTVVSALPTVLPSRLVCLPPLCLPASGLQPGDLCPLVATSSDYSCGLVLSHCTSLPASASRLRSHAGRAPWPSVWASLWLSHPLPSAEAVLSCRSWALQPSRAVPRQQPLS